MRQQILRCTAVGLFGNDYLASGLDERLIEVHFRSCFKGVESLDFVRPQAHRLAAPGSGFSAGTKHWFRRLKSDGIEALRLHLPVSIFETLPNNYGLILDGAYGSEVYVPSANLAGKHYDFVATKIAAWSIPPLVSAQAAMEDHLAALANLQEVVPAHSFAFGQLVEGLVKAAKTRSDVMMGCEDLVPDSFGRERKLQAAAAYRTVVSFTVPSLDLNQFSFAHRQVEAAWNSALRLLEALCAEIGASTAAAA